MIGQLRTLQARELLESDRVWSAYALADLAADEQAQCTWLVGARSVVLLYAGFQPPVLFAHGDPGECRELLQALPVGPVMITLRQEVLAAFSSRLVLTDPVPMWRMSLQAGGLVPALGEGTQRLGPADLDAIQALFAGQADRPDAFHPRQLDSGVFYGIWAGAQLVCVAGTHVVSPELDVAALGNVFTLPSLRARGLATRATAAVVDELRRLGLTTIVLNVAQDNTPAIRCYHRLGFREHCPYVEGIGRLHQPADDRLE
jgi:GNAT superfamily N-acetyltransferase